MKRAIIIGSCQAKAITINLRILNPGYTFNALELNETELSPEEIYREARNYDTIICFALDEKSWGPLQVDALRESGKALIIPRIYFNGFHPDFMYVSANGARIKGLRMAYHMRLALSGALQGLSQGQVLDLYRTQFYVNEEANKLFDRSLKILHEKESLADLRVSDLIFDNGADYPPLYAFNHPSPELLMKWVVRIATRLAEQFGYKFDYTNFKNYFYPFFNADIVLPYMPGIQMDRFPLIPRSTSVRLAAHQDYRLLSLEELIADEYELIAGLDPAQVRELRAFPGLYEDLPR